MIIRAPLYDSLLTHCLLETPRHLVVAVSGGADSMALCLLTAQWCQKRHLLFTALTVDHGLRVDSSQEAEQVHQWLHSRGIDHHILQWKGPKPSSNLQAKAREARYRLLMQWCLQHQGSALLLAHHLDDQAETFLLNLSRGSGLNGLSGMLPAYQHDDLWIIRPLLSVCKKDLEATCRFFKQDWVHDPSNDNLDFKRVRVRHLLPLLDQELGLSSERIGLAVRHLQRARASLDADMDAFFAHAATQTTHDILLNKKLFLALSEEIGLRVLAKTLISMGGQRYTPRFERLQRLYQWIKEKTRHTCTLGSCLIQITPTHVRVQKEKK